MYKYIYTYYDKLTWITYIMQDHKRVICQFEKRHEDECERAIKCLSERKEI